MNGATFKKPLSHLSLIIQECWPLLNVWGIIHLIILVILIWIMPSLRYIDASSFPSAFIASIFERCTPCNSHAPTLRSCPKHAKGRHEICHSHCHSWALCCKVHLHGWSFQGISFTSSYFLGTSMLFDCQLPHAWPVHGRRRFWRDSVHWCCPSGRLPASPGALRSYSNRSSYT